jgi:glucose-1-phosphate adenylyltransferase
MNDSMIEPHARVERAIVDKEVVIGAGAEVGYGVDNVPNRQYPARLNTGLTVIGKHTRIPQALKIGHNVIVNPYLCEENFTTDFVASGETI